jgi:hypothetical protein
VAEVAYIGAQLPHLIILEDHIVGFAFLQAHKTSADEIT